MPKAARELSALEVKRITHSGGRGNDLAAVGAVPGLYLQVLPSGVKTWILRATVGNKRRDIGLGGYPEISLAVARDKAREAREAIRAGRDPVEDRKAVKAELVAARKRNLTFAEAFERYFAEKLGLGSEADRKRWRSSIEGHVLPHIGSLLVAEVMPQDVQRVLLPLWQDKTETARRVRARIEAILAWATVAGHREGDNPARWKNNIEMLLKDQERKAAGKDNQPAISVADAPAWFAALRQREGMGARALEFLTLCASRSGEVRGATWAEIDLKAGLWVIPAARMKMDREHKVPLGQAALALLAALPRFEGTDLVFPSVRGGPLSDMTLSKTMKDMHAREIKAGRSGWLDKASKRPAVPHGLRSTFRDWAAETGVAREMAETALAHKVGSEVERAYLRTDMVERRRDMMAEWAGYLRGCDGH